MSRPTTSESRCACGSALPSARDRTCTACQVANNAAHMRRRAQVRITLDVRAAVIARDGHVCRYCGGAVVEGSGGRYPNRDRLELDHVVPVASGGQSTADNLVVSCLLCNRRKHNREVAPC